MLSSVKGFDRRRKHLITCAFCCVLCSALLAGCSSSSSTNSGNESGSGSTQSSQAASQSATQIDAKADSSASAASSNESSPASAEKKVGTVGEPIAVQGRGGELEITVDGFETSADMRERFSYGENIKEGKTVGVLLLKVKNVSYDDKYNKGFVSLEPGVQPIDADGISLDSLSSAYDYGEYNGAAGAFFECEVGQAKREAVFYIVDEGITDITIMVGGVEVPVSVAAV